VLALLWVKAKVNRIFDHQNPSDVNQVVEDLRRRKKENLEELINESTEKTSYSYWEKQYEHLDDLGLKNKYIRQSIENTNDSVVALQAQLKDVDAVIDRLKANVYKGKWHDIEKEIAPWLRSHGFDAFTTGENGKNVMLLNPKEQFIPLFDPERKGTLGFKKGGAIYNLQKRVGKK
jgi:phosphotransacetylase